MMTPSSLQHTLAPWQSLQAAMLYHFSSVDYLKRLHAAVTGMIDGVVDPILDLAKLQQRDVRMHDARWGNRNTSDTWANYAWPFLKDLQQSLAKDIALRAFDQYRKTATMECLGGAEQYSMLWASANEEERYQAAVRLISQIALPVDTTLDSHENSRWNDFGFMNAYPSFRTEHPTRSTYTIRTDLVANTGSLPPRTGVYVSANDPHAALQFAWREGHGCKLRQASTFNSVGLAALQYVGRAGLWSDTRKMHEFATQPQFLPLYQAWLNNDGTLSEELAPALVATTAFERKPSTWYFVEPHDGEQVATDLVWGGNDVIVTPVRIKSGQQCKVSGFYYSPAQQKSRRFFNVGEVMPDLNGDYGDTLWQWDERQ